MIADDAPSVLVRPRPRVLTLDDVGQRIDRGATSAEAPPPKPLKSATISGMAVISTRQRREAAPMPAADDDAGEDPR